MKTVILRKTALVIFIVVIVAAAAAALTACDGLRDALVPSADAETIAGQVVRIHIRANSNSSGDQEVKLAVRDEVTAYLTETLEGCTNKADALAALGNETENLRVIAQSTLEKHGFNYKVSVELKKENFPDREYDGYLFPAGVYDALMIYLGEGRGDNWWCVAFPPLCFVPASDGDKIVYTSWVKELLDRIF